MKTKLGFVAVLLVLFFASAQAVTLNVPQEIPTGANWSFSAEFSSLDFTEARILFDNSALVSVLVYNSAVTVAPGSTNNALALNAVASGNTLVVSMNGLSQGTHTVQADIYRNSEKIDSATAGVKAETSAGTRQEIDSIHASMNSFAAQMDKVKTQIEELSTGLNSVQSSKSAFDQKASEISSALEEIKAKIANMDGEIQLLISEIDSVKNPASLQAEKQPGIFDGIVAFFTPKTAAQPPAENSAADETNAEQTNTGNEAQAAASATGFFSLAGMGDFFWIILIVIAAIVVFAAWKFLGKGTAGFGGKSRVDMDSVMQPSMKDAIADQGKWSFEQSPSKKSPSLGTTFGNLIRRK
ncbi:MAG TPA: hypothetical protein VI977_04535 [archaeon]|nr:hypothetical protein [archaeon]